MNQDELIEKCRLTHEEVRRAKLDSGVLAMIHRGDYPILEAQLRKAIPIIQKAEGGRIVNILEKEGKHYMPVSRLPASFMDRLSDNSGVWAIPYKLWQELKEAYDDRDASP